MPAFAPSERERLLVGGMGLMSVAVGEVEVVSLESVAEELEEGPEGCAFDGGCGVTVGTVSVDIAEDAGGGRVAVTTEDSALDKVKVVKLGVELADCFGMVGLMLTTLQALITFCVASS